VDGLSRDKKQVNKEMQESDKLSKLEVVAEFIHEIRSLSNSEVCLSIAMSDFHVFSVEESRFQLANDFDWKNQVSDNTEFDLILADLPLGLNRVEHEIGGERLKIRRNWVEMHEALSMLSAGGIAVILIEPTAFSSKDGIVFEKLLNKEGYYVGAIFNAPSKILEPLTSITPVFVLISKAPVEKIFVAELLNQIQSKEVVGRYYIEGEGNDLKKGMLLPQFEFESFRRIEIEQQIEKLETEFKEFDTYTIGDLATEINYVKSGEKLTEKENSVYIPKIGSSSVVSSLSDTTIKHQNYYQVVLGNKAANEYVAAFFRSALGRLVVGSLATNSAIPHTNKSAVEQAFVCLPEITVQKRILRTQSKLTELNGAIEKFEEELALNPISSSAILGQLDSMLEVINGLTEIDKVHNLLRQGETKNIEYKETLSVDVRSNKKEKYIELSALKTIVAFLNTDGGTLEL
jgi:hypothetical protein